MLEGACELLLGLVLVGLMGSDVFLTVIVPRAVSRRWRPSAYITRYAWIAVDRVGARILNPDTREEFLSKFAPFILVVTLVFWLAGLILAYGIIFYALRAHLHPVGGFADALYFAGTSFLTIGYGDITPGDPWTRLFSLFAGASGFGVVAITTSFLFAIFGSFQAREIFVVTLSTRAGVPPSGLDLLLESARVSVMAGLPDLFREGQRWAAALMESHLAYPVLAFFRSSHDEESWIATLGAILDAATLCLTTLRGYDGEAQWMHDLGRHAVVDLTRYFHLAAEEGPGIDRSEFVDAHAQLAALGLPVIELDEAWANFSRLRAEYAAPLNAMARFFDIPPARWVGDRSLLHRPRH
jgi:hypothetical protein